MERGKGKGKVRETASITKGKNIVIWGIGALQSDLEGACAFEHVLYYIDDYMSEKKEISISKRQENPEQ